jgi:hypothetical protein
LKASFPQTVVRPAAPASKGNRQIANSKLPPPGPIGEFQDSKIRVRDLTRESEPRLEEQIEILLPPLQLSNVGVSASAAHDRSGRLTAANAC